MFFTYTASVVLVSLAIYGILCLLHDLWGFLYRRSVRIKAGVSLLILVRNLEDQVEYLIYDLIQRLEESEMPCDAVIIDCGSEDLTYEIASRMTRYSAQLAVYRIPGGLRPVGDALPLCRGSVIHLLDLVSRIPVQDCIPVVNQLLYNDEPSARGRG